MTGRSIDGGPATDDVPGTIDQTAREITNRGGRGSAVRCDHTIDADGSKPPPFRVPERA